MRTVPVVLTCGALVAALAAPAPLRPQDADERFRAASDAWRAGRYPEALDGLDALLSANPPDPVVAAAALLTGELYRVHEVAPDGTAPRWSADGRYLAYEARGGTELSAVSCQRSADCDEGMRRVEGTGLAFSPDGAWVAYLVLEAGSELDRARAEVQRRIAVRDRESFMRFQREMRRVVGEHRRVALQPVEGGEEAWLNVTGIGVQEIVYAADGNVYALGNATGDATRTDVYRLSADAAPRRLTDAAAMRSGLATSASSLVYGGDGGRVGVVDLARDRVHEMDGTSPALSADGSRVVFVRAAEGENAIVVAAVADGSESVAARVAERVANPALSPGGDRVAYQRMPREDWELFVIGADGGDHRRLTYEIQHDLFPRFVTDDVILAVIGEGRHRRSYLYDVATGDRTRLFHNNTLRTVAPEYEWAVSPDASKVLIVSERDGDTISPERGVYLVDLAAPLSRDDVLARVRAMAAAERDLRARGEAMFGPVAERVRPVVADVSTSRIYGYARDLFAFGSKFITEPGNRMAIDYLAERLRSFGYEPELQWFEPRPGITSANVIVTLPGTVDPELVYVVSSHFDSVNRGPGADDNSSGTTALLEAARVLAGRPQPATIKFAFFTGEEAGLLGSREFVRRAVADGVHIVGALNNDMVGYANDERLDNTIRYSNAGVRDLQHAAAFLFTDLITYDAKYYKSTDAHAYYDAYGDIVGGIGSYPILGNPHYHQSHDVLETINQQLVAEVSKTTVASLILLASSPSRLTGLSVQRRGGDAVATWTPAVESDVSSYVVTYGPADDPARHRISVTEAEAQLEGVEEGWVVRVKAENAPGLMSWDWAEGVVGR